MDVTSVAARTLASGTYGDSANLEDERARVTAMADRIRGLETRGDTLARSIDELAAQISTIESHANNGKVPSGEGERYQRLIRRHNALVDQYNEIGGDLRTQTAEYNTALTTLNVRIDRYNATH